MATVSARTTRRLSSERFIRVARALSDPQRVALLERIAREPEVACKTLVEEFHITPATISHHIKELAEAGLIDYRREGKCAHFKVRAATMAAFRQNLAALSQFPASGPGARPRRSTARAKVSPKAVAG